MHVLHQCCLVVFHWFMSLFFLFFRTADAAAAAAATAATTAATSITSRKDDTRDRSLLDSVGNYKCPSSFELLVFATFA